MLLRAATLCAIVALIAGSLRSAYAVLDSDAHDRAVAAALGKRIVAACPMARLDDTAARDSCGRRLAAMGLLQDSLADPLRWGGQKAGAGFDIAKSPLTDINAFVWTKEYLSAFMFKSSTVERIDDSAGTIAIRLNGLFRAHIPPGDVPYPFWHSKTKWDQYVETTQVVLVMQQHKVVAGFRNGALDPSHQKIARTFDGNWTWTDSSGEQPRVSLYSYLFSKGNPYVAKLDGAYRVFETQARAQSCQTCHNPSNPAKMNPLALLTFPNQALSTRHLVIRKLERNEMPPGGIKDERARASLIAAARSFAQTGDAALNYEKAQRR